MRTTTINDDYFTTAEKKALRKLERMYNRIGELMTAARNLEDEIIKGKYRGEAANV